MAANNHHSTQQYLVNGTMLLYTIEFVLLYRQSKHSYTLGVVPTVSATNRSPTIAATSPSMPQSTDYVTTSQSTPRASSTSTSSSYSSQPTNAS